MREPGCGGVGSGGGVVHSTDKTGDRGRGREGGIPGHRVRHDGRDSGW